MPEEKHKWKHADTQMNGIQWHSGYRLKNIVFLTVSLCIAVLAISFIAIYPVFIDYHFPQAITNNLFSLFYLVIFLNYLGFYNADDDYKSKSGWIFTNFRSIILSTVMSAIFAIILNRTSIDIAGIFFILVCGLTLCYATIILLKKQVVLILFWINFYLFIALLIFSQFPKIPLDVVSKFNPYGGLLVTLFGGAL